MVQNLKNNLKNFSAGKFSETVYLMNSYIFQRCCRYFCGALYLPIIAFVPVSV